MLSKLNTSVPDKIPKLCSLWISHEDEDYSGRICNFVNKSPTTP